MPKTSVTDSTIIARGRVVLVIIILAAITAMVIMVLSNTDQIFGTNGWIPIFVAVFGLGSLVIIGSLSIMYARYRRDKVK